jgi:hypothetical protein
MHATLTGAAGRIEIAPGLGTSWSGIASRTERTYRTLSKAMDIHPANHLKMIAHFKRTHALGSSKYGQGLVCEL